MPKDGGSAPVTCPDCNKTFSKRDHLVRHARTHTGDRPYSCPVCGKSYARSDVARRHVAAHGKQQGLNGDADSQSLSSPTFNTLGVHPAPPSTGTAASATTSATEQQSEASSSSPPPSTSSYHTGHHNNNSNNNNAGINSSHGVKTEPVGPTSSELDQPGVDLLGSLSLNHPLSMSTDLTSPHRAQGHLPQMQQFDNSSHHLPISHHQQQQQQQQQQHGGRRDEEAQLLANFSSNSHATHHSPGPFYFPPQHQQAQQIAPPPPPPQQQPSPSHFMPQPTSPLDSSSLLSTIDNTDWDQQLRDIFQSFPGAFAPTPAGNHHHNGSHNNNNNQSNVSPLADLTDASQFFDFSVLLSPEGACNRLSNMRPHTPPPQPSNISPAEKLMNIWPTRPSRRTRRTNAAIAASSSSSASAGQQGRRGPPDAGTGGPDDMAWEEAQQQQQHSNPHIVDPSAAQRMYAHLQGGGIPFTKPVPPAEALTDLLALYFEYVHPIWPMLHPPTFSPATSSSLLMLNMVALGALFLKTQEGDELAAAIMEKMHESLSFCMSAQLELYLDPADQDVLALTQAYMMRQLYWLCSGNRNQLEATQLFHSTVANVARRGNLFAPDAVEELEKGSEDRQPDIEAEWRNWVSTEVRRRTALCFMLNDLTFAVTFMVPPYLTVGSIAWSLPSSDQLFEARSAQEWQYNKEMLGPGPTVPLYTTATSLFTTNAESVLRQHKDSAFSLHLLVGSMTSIVLTTRVSRPNLENELAMDPKAQAPVTNALSAAYNVLTMNGEHDNRFYTLVMWHWCYIHLLCDLRMIELACGREGPEVAKKASARAGPWATSPAARRAVLHCVAILRIAKAATVGSEVPPHLYIALYQAWMILRTFSWFFPHASLPKSVQWGILGAFGASNDVSKTPTMSIPDAQAVDWIKSGREASPIMGVKLTRAMQDMLETMRRVGYTKLRVMLAEVIEAIEMADTAHVGQYAPDLGQR